MNSSSLGRSVSSSCLRPTSTFGWSTTSQGMATVYLAEDLEHERNVALKVLPPELAAVLGASSCEVAISHAAELHAASRL
jgi:hypothetical protein